MKYPIGGALGDQTAYPRGETWSIPTGEHCVTKQPIQRRNMEYPKGGTLGDRTAYPKGGTLATEQPIPKGEHWRQSSLSQRGYIWVTKQPILKGEHGVSQPGNIG
jgi:hypothetical protein